MAHELTADSHIGLGPYATKFREGLYIPSSDISARCRKTVDNLIFALDEEIRKEIERGHDGILQFKKTEKFVAKFIKQILGSDGNLDELVKQVADKSKPLLKDFKCHIHNLEIEKACQASRYLFIYSSILLSNGRYRIVESLANTFIKAEKVRSCIPSDDEFSLAYLDNIIFRGAELRYGVTEIAPVAVTDRIKISDSEIAALEACSDLTGLEINDIIRGIMAIEEGSQGK